MHAYLSILPLTLTISLSSTGMIATRSIMPSNERTSTAIAQVKGDDADNCPLRGCGRRYQNTSDRGSGRFQQLMA